jgi:hypothetical protein
MLQYHSAALVTVHQVLFMRYYSSTSSSSVLMTSDIIALPVADAEIPRQRLDALVATAEAAEEKAAAARHRILAARQLLDKE